MSRCHIGWFKSDRKLFAEEGSIFVKRPGAHLVYLLLSKWAAISDEEHAMPRGDKILKGQICCTRDEISLALKKNWGLAIQPHIIKRDIIFLIKNGFIKKVNAYKNDHTLAAIYELSEKFGAESETGLRPDSDRTQTGLSPS